MGPYCRFLQVFCNKKLIFKFSDFRRIQRKTSPKSWTETRRSMCDHRDANRTLSQTVHLYAPKTTRKSTLIHRILSQKFGKCMWPRFFLRLKLSTNRLKKLSYIITRILLGCQLNGRNTVRIPLWKC